MELQLVHGGAGLMKQLAGFARAAGQNLRHLGVVLKSRLGKAAPSQVQNADEQLLQQCRRQNYEKGSLGHWSSGDWNAHKPRY